MIKKYIVAIMVSIVVYNLVYRWLDKNKWLNSQFDGDIKSTNKTES